MRFGYWLVMTTRAAVWICEAIVEANTNPAEGQSITTGPDKTLFSLLLCVMLVSAILVSVF